MYHWYLPGRSSTVLLSFSLFHFRASDSKCGVCVLAYRSFGCKQLYGYIWGKRYTGNYFGENVRIISIETVIFLILVKCIYIGLMLIKCV
jgi:hypothetical protein